MLSSDIAVDFGTSTIRIVLSGKGLVINEPALIAQNTDTGEILAMGRSAHAMLGRTPQNVQLCHPFVDGRIDSYSLAEYMVTTYIKKIGMGKLFLPSAVLSAPMNMSEVEKHALSDVVERSGIRKIDFIEETAAAAMGAGLNIKSSVGLMVADIGEVSSAMAIMAGSQVIAKNRIPVAGKNYTEALVRYIRKKHGIEVGPQSAESAKCEIGSAFPRDKVTSCRVKGRNVHTGLPGEIVLTSDETVEAFADTSAQIAKSLEDCLELVPPEILGDISRGGIVLTGGTSKLYGLDKYLERRLKLAVHGAENPETAVVVGAAKKL